MTPREYKHQQLLDILEAYITGGKIAEHLLDDLEIDDPYDDVTRLDIAAARILLQSVGPDLPYVARMTNGEFFSTQRQWMSLSDPVLHFDPKLLFIANWAMGPSQDWLEAFYSTHVPGFDVWVVTASHGSDDLFGCLDYAIGVSEPGASLEESAKKILKDYLAQRKRDYQDRWITVPKLGKAGSSMVNSIEGNVWGWRNP